MIHPDDFHKKKLEKKKINLMLLRWKIENKNLCFLYDRQTPIWVHGVIRPVNNVFTKPIEI